MLRRVFCWSLFSVMVLLAPAWGQQRVAAEPASPAGPAVGAKLKRLVVGNQGAILKVWKPGDAYVADYYRGLDDRDTAPYSAKDQEALATSLGLVGGELEKAALEVLQSYAELPKKNALAFLGLVNSLGNDSPWRPTPEVSAKVKKFLVTRLKEDKNVIIRRQACLSLAVGEAIDAEVLEAVLDFYSGTENLWETFPVQQFFEYHAQTIRALPNFEQIRARVAGVNSLYRAGILGYLDGTR